MKFLMRFLGKLVASVIVFFNFAGLCEAQSAVVQSKGIVHGGHGYILHLRLWNCGSVTIATDIANLPWGQDRLTLAIANPGRSTGVVEPADAEISDFPDKTVTISPGNFVDGAVSLDNRFARSHIYRDLKGAVLFWAYDGRRIKTSANAVIEPSGGMIRFNDPLKEKLPTPCQGRQN